MGIGEDSHVLSEVRGHAGVITLNRVKALNALSSDMVCKITDVLLAWRENPVIKHVVIKSSSEKAFCAGGDIRQLYDDGPEKAADSIRFFASEYRLNHLMGTFEKPIVALIDGIFMGGGVGISVHGRYRVGSERLLFSMPETAIGFFPDVGGSYFLPRLPSKIGYYCGLTAGRMRLGDCYEAGLVTHKISSQNFEALLNALCENEDVARVLDDYHDVELGSVGAVWQQREKIENWFSAQSLPQALELIQIDCDAGDEFAQKTIDELQLRSPTSLLVTFEQIKRGKELSLQECLAMEYGMVWQVLQSHDFYEGIRAVLVDKDQKPKWQPATFAGVTRELVEKYFSENDQKKIDFYSSYAGSPLPQ
ncbi:enoyl-CoA hydratase/isomerase family protein [Polycladidibacter stylochi]|uniref:enoyl-CoA hydratase/isomerase family protein n=1 Tax=Polycladidibacter stylochi TaxID=1807766 RepID=UPI000835985A|nr:enoyl-CoA hydratase/isomerase family protein [Pseudovibrio stylochi]